jgi:hypothetical protein
MGNHVAQEADKVIIGGGHTVLRHQLWPCRKQGRPNVVLERAEEAASAWRHFRLVTSIWSVRLPSAEVQSLVSETRRLEWEHNNGQGW